MNLNRTKRFLLLFAVFIFALACRTTELVAQVRPTPTNTRPRPTSTRPRPTRTEVVVQAEVVPSTNTPGAPKPTSQPQAHPTNTVRAANPPAVHPPTARPTNTPAPPPTANPFPYQVQESRCGPNVRTYIEGYVYDNGSPKNDVLVRISQGPDGGPDPNDDYKTGSDPKKGYFFQNIDVNAPHEGTWYLWVIDPTTQQRISAIAIVKTDGTRVEDNGNSAGSCQSATITFSNQGTRPIPRTSTPGPTRNPGAGPTPTPTRDTLNDS